MQLLLIQTNFIHVFHSSAISIKFPTDPSLYFLHFNDNSTNLKVLIDSNFVKPYVLLSLRNCINRKL